MSKRKICPAKCDGCLSTNRNLSPIKDQYDIYLTLMGDMEKEKIDSDLPVMCWECLAVLRNIEKFRQNVLKAKRILSGKIKKGQKGPDCLSNLIITQTDAIIDIKEEETDIKLELNIKLEENTANDFEETKPNKEFNADTELKDKFVYEYEILEEKVKIKTYPDATLTEEKEKVDEKRKKCVPQKYKVIRLCGRGELKISYDKVVIDNVERTYWLEQERNNRSYKQMVYKCELCVVGFTKEEYYLRHLQIFHSKISGRYVCDICKKQFKLKKILQLHVEKHNVKYVCKLCQYECYRSLRIYRHFENAHRKTLECLMCGLRFPDRHIFTKHYDELHLKFVCDYCGAGFNTKKLIISHIRYHHSVHTCKKCRKIYKNFSILVKHNNLHHVKSASELCYCVECNVQFNNVSLYKRHLKQSFKHTKKRPLKVGVACPECDKTYCTRYEMMNHYMYVHLKKTKYFCNICNKYFRSAQRFREHKASIHDKIPKVKNKMCTYCNRGFSDNRMLANHVRTHTGERPFACTHCTSAFTQRQALVSHTRSVHKRKIK